MDKVKISIENITKRIGKPSSKFEQFLNDNCMNVFTPELIVDRSDLKLYILKEDNTNPKWVFFKEDLIFLDRKD